MGAGIYALYIIALRRAAEAVVGLALVLTIYRNSKTIFWSSR